MKEVEGGWIPDFSSRYFTEDFPYGMRFIVETAHEQNVAIPTIENIYQWGLSKTRYDAKNQLDRLGKGMVHDSSRV